MASSTGSGVRVRSTTSLVVGLTALAVAAIVLLREVGQVRVDGVVIRLDGALVVGVLLVLLGVTGLVSGVLRLRRPRDTEGAEQALDA